MIRENTPSLWLDNFPIPLDDGNKYDRGHAVVFGAPELIGATRLAAEAASHIGAGLVSVVADENPTIYRQTLSADIMVRTSLDQLNSPSALLFGPGGVTNLNRNLVTLLLELYYVVLDADMLNQGLAFSTLGPNCVLTPHLGEFRRLFPEMESTVLDDEADGNFEELASMGAEKTGAVMVLKGPETVVAHPDGRISVNRHTSPFLAKAGTGDVLSGMITGLLAQGMSPFEAASAAVWMHGDAACNIGPGLVASDMPDEMHKVISKLVLQGNNRL